MGRKCDPEESKVKACRREHFQSVRDTTRKSVYLEQIELEGNLIMKVREGTKGQITLGVIISHCKNSCFYLKGNKYFE